MPPSPWARSCSRAPPTSAAPSRRHRPEPRFRRRGVRLRRAREFRRPDRRRRAQLVRRAGPGHRLGRGVLARRPAVVALHLWPRRLVDPGGAVQRRAAAGRGRRHRLGGDPAAARSRAGRGRHRDGRRRHRHRHQRRDGAGCSPAGRKGDLNIRGAFLHMVADAAVSAGVVVAALVILFTGWVGSTRSPAS